MIHECMMTNRFDLLLERGASIDIDVGGGGLTVRNTYISHGPQITAVIQKWIRKRAGQEGLLESKECKNCGSKGPNYRCVGAADS